jgi:glycosyltransferase involved in cell wall biosynthesis
MTAKIIVAANTVWYLANFRMNLFKALMTSGQKVTALAPFGSEATKIEALGVKFVPIEMDKMSTNPLKDFMLLIRFIGAFLHERPLVYLGYTIKPNIYGGIACQLLGIPSVHNISGLGATFIRETLLTKVVCKSYRFALRKAAKIFFQNQEDLDLFKHRKIVRSHQTERLPGSGVDTEWFAPDHHAASKFQKNIGKDRPFIFLLSARLLWDKGIGEYLKAARFILYGRKDVEFQLLGFFDDENPAAIPKSVVEQWELEGVIRYLGKTDDVRPFIAQADCVVLPSYREGTPRSLLEAASMGKPIITTDEVGCRETVEDGVTGYLCKSRDAADLAEKMRFIMSAPKEKLEQMGVRGRQKMIREFDEKIVIDHYLETVSMLVQKARSGSQLGSSSSVPKGGKHPVNHYEQKI